MPSCYMAYQASLLIKIVKSILFVSEIVGSIIPMLFTPVPSTQIFRDNIYRIFRKEDGIGTCIC